MGMLGGDLFGAHSAWTVTEERKSSRPPQPIRRGGLSKSSSAAALLQSKSSGVRRKADAGAGISSRGSTGESHFSASSAYDALPALPAPDISGDGGYANFKARFQKEFAQQQRCSSLAVPRRQRVVADTLQVVRDNQFDPAEGLAEAARAVREAEEAYAMLRRTDLQSASCTNLAQRRPKDADPDGEEEQAPTRSWAEQKAHCESLAEPRPVPPPPSFPGTPAINAVRSVAEQLRYCSRMAQPRPPLPGEAPPGAVSAWRENLAARASAMIPGEVQEARSLLERMRAERPKSALRRPRSAQRREKAPDGPGAEECSEANARMVSELRALVEEVLWVVLLQVRSVPRGEGASTALEERLGSLLISSVGPALKPVARKVLGAGCGLIRRLRGEFPRLARHLMFRDCEDLDPAPSSWKEEEILSHLAQVRESRDALLGMDLTKDAIARLGEGAASAYL